MRPHLAAHLKPLGVRRERRAIALDEQRAVQVDGLRERAEPGLAGRAAQRRRRAVVVRFASVGVVGGVVTTAGRAAVRRQRRRARPARPERGHAGPGRRRATAVVMPRTASSSNAHA